MLSGDCLVARAPVVKKSEDASGPNSSHRELVEAAAEREQGEPIADETVTECALVDQIVRNQF
jgi:hypothetical protein